MREIQDKMVKEQNLKEIWLPLESKETDVRKSSFLSQFQPRVNIFLSDDALTNKHAVVVIICGTGAVRCVF